MTLVPWSPETNLSPKVFLGLDNDVTALPDGGYVVTWDDTSSSSFGSSGVFFQRLDATGKAMAPPVQINQISLKYAFNLQIEPLSNGGFVAVYRSGQFVDSREMLRGRVFDAQGNPVGPEQEFVARDGDGKYEPSISAMADGGFALSWVRAFGDGDTSVQVARFDDLGRQIGTVIEDVAASDKYDVVSAVLGLANGYTAVTWSNPQIRLQIYDENGAATGSAQIVSGVGGGGGFAADVSLRMAQLDEGRFVVIWHSESRDAATSDRTEIFARVFEQDGTAAGPAFMVNTGIGSFQRNPDVTVLSDGRFLVIWYSYDEQPGDVATVNIQARFFDSDGQPLGDEIRVNDNGFFRHFEPKVTELVDGRVAIVWATDISLRTNDSVVRGAIFDPRETGIDIEGSSMRDAYFGTQYDDTMVSGLGADVLWGRAGNDDLMSGGGADDVRGGAGADQISGGRGNDDLKGGQGGDTVSGGAGQDILKGGADDDTLNGGQNSDILLGGTGDDRLEGQRGDDVISGQVGDDLLLGQLGDDLMFGGQGNDVLRGGDGRDVLNGGAGQDLMEGDAGRDTFVFNAVSASAAGTTQRDTIGDFQSGQDQIKLNAIDAGSADAAFDFIATAQFSATAGELRYESEGDNTRILGDTDGDGTADFEILLEGTFTLTLGDFIL